MELLTLWLFLIGAFIALIFSANAIATLLRVKVPFVTTPGWVIRWLSEHADLKPGQTFIELGCGDARVLAALSKRFPQSWFIGYELSWWPLALARFRTRNLKNVELRQQNFYHVSLAEADALFCYLLTTVMPKLGSQLEQQLKLGAMIYSYAFSFPSWTPLQSLVKPGKRVGTRLWVYRR